MTSTATEPAQQGSLHFPPEPGAPGRRTFEHVAFVVIVALAAAVITYVVASVVPATYKASSQLRMTVNGSSGLGQDAVTGGNSLAAQVVQLAPSDAVLSGPATRLGMSVGKLRDALTAGTIAQQNIVQVSTTGSSEAQAEQRASTVTSALIAYLQRDSSRQVQSYTSSVSGAIGAMDGQIAQLAHPKGRTTPFQESILQGEVGAVAAQIEALRGQMAQHVAASVPVIQEIQSPTSASKVAPRPTLYAIVALLVAGVIAVQLVTLRARRFPTR